MIPKLIRAAGRFGVYAGIGAGLVQLVVQVQNMVAELQPDDDHDAALVAVLTSAPPDPIKLPEAASFAAGYVDGWTDAAAGLDPKICHAEGTDDE